MPTVSKTWKPNQSFPNGTTVLGQDEFGPMSGVVRIEINRASIPVGGILEIVVESRKIGAAEWQPQFGAKIEMNGTPNKDGTFVTKLSQPFEFVENSEIRAVAIVTNGPFPFDAKAVASW
jgi:hypothetical protein